LRPKTIDAYSRLIRHIGACFSHRVESLSEAQLRDYFTELLDSHSWSTVKLDFFGRRSEISTPLVRPEPRISVS